MGMPLSRQSSWANSSALSSIMSPTRHSALARSAGGDVTHHAGYPPGARFVVSLPAG